MSVTILYHVFNWSKFVCWTSANMFQIFRILWGSYIFWVKTWRFDCIRYHCSSEVLWNSFQTISCTNNKTKQFIRAVWPWTNSCCSDSTLPKFQKVILSYFFLQTVWQLSAGHRMKEFWTENFSLFFLTVLCVFALHFTFNKNTNLPIEIIIIV